MAKGRGGFIGQDGLNAPDAPTIGTASVASSTSLSIAFTAPTDVGGSAITEYLASARDSAGNVIGASGASSPVTVTGLTLGTAYTITVIARNSHGSSVPSAASNSATPIVQGQQAYTTAGSYSWTAPTGVTSVSVVAVGAGGGGNLYHSNYNTGGGGGGLGYINNHSVTAGNSYTVVVGAVGAKGGSGSRGQDGGDSYFVNTSTCKGGGGGGANPNGGSAGVGNGDGGGNGGVGGQVSNTSPVGSVVGGGGGASGYSGNGGFGGVNQNGPNPSGAGAGGGGGGGIQNGGGGVGILGEGTSGAAVSGNSGNGKGGSGGTDGGGSGGVYGGGGGYNGDGGVGAVRIIWPGATRTFPSTNTGDV